MDLRGLKQIGLKLAPFLGLGIKRDSEEMEVLMSRPRGSFPLVQVIIILLMDPPSNCDDGYVKFNSIYFALIV